jgi:hypothetical protein
MFSYIQTKSIFPISCYFKIDIEFLCYMVICFMCMPSKFFSYHPVYFERLTVHYFYCKLQRSLKMSCIHQMNLCNVVPLTNTTCPLILVI